MKGQSIRLLVFVLLAQTRTAFGEENAVEAGRALAQEICSACHSIGADQGVPPIMNPPAPAFRLLAQRHKLDETNLRRLLSSPHGRAAGDTKMPNPMLADYQIDTLVDYLRARRLSR